MTVNNMTLRPNTSYAPIPFVKIETPACQWILYAEINKSRIRVWDLSIFVPNILFLLYLVVRFRGAIAKLQASSSPIFATFYILVVSVSIISVLRCIVSMTVDATTEAGDVTDKILWLLLRFFLLATELSVVIFGLAFGHLDSRTSIRRVLIVTFFIALLYSLTQGVLELRYNHPVFTAKTDDVGGLNGTNTNFNLFAHGGMIFLFSSSFLNFAVYAAIIVLPFTRLRERFQLPTKRLFYYYCLMLATLNLCQALASLLLYLDYHESLCGIDVTTYVYFSLFDPVVYGVFLWNFFASVSTSGVHFSYKQQDDSVEDDQLSLPYSNSGSINKDDHEDHSDPIFSYGNTHLDVDTSSTVVTTRPTMSLNNGRRGGAGGGLYSSSDVIS